LSAGLGEKENDVTVNKLHKILTELIAKGHGRNTVYVDEPTFHSHPDGDEYGMLDISGVKGPEFVVSTGHNGEPKLRIDGSECGKMAVILYGCMHDA
jgi:hypothetical protein